ncbi:MAG: NUDIX hydrolase [Candidatus Taylorbacteria bacterium]|nr:NUDIX hydrolase [Candidatus Taylorbacteria bacterium]
MSKRTPPAVARKRTVKPVAVLHDDKWLSAHRVNVHFDNGKTIKNFLILRMKGNGYVSVTARLTDGRFVLTEQCRPIAGMSIESAGGVYETKKKAEAVVKMELAQETGYRPGRLVRINRFGFYSETDRIDDRCHLFLAFDCKPLPQLGRQDEKQGVGTLILTAAQVVQKILRGEIKDLATIAGIFAHLLHAHEGEKVFLKGR